MIKGTVALGLGASLTGCAVPESGAGKSRSARNAIQTENAREGTTDWMLTNTRIDPKTKYRCPWIEGYCSHTSVAAGQDLSIFVSTKPASDFTIEIYRMGYYGGQGGRLVRDLGPFKGKAQPEPKIGERRLRECEWEPATTIRIPRDWVSGVYLGKLTEHTQNFQSYVIFIVRDSRKADLIFQCSDTTWQAYNRWPNQFALYDDGKNEWYWGPGVDVSFDRPYGKYCQILNAPLSIGSGEWFLWEFPFAHWLEANGYDVTYTSCLDLHAHPKNFLRAKGFISIGHDEYYSIEMFENLRSLVAQGLNVSFFSGNTCCGRIDPRPSATGIPNRIFSRVDAFGPPDPADLKRLPTMALLPHKSPCSSVLVGARNLAPYTGGADWICAEPDHWIFAGSGMKAGDGIPGLVGWEWQGEPADIPGLVTVASGKTQSNPGELNGGTYAATLYPGPKHNFVFNASTCWWGDGLSAPPGYVRPSVYTSPKGPDPRAQQITRNILDRMIRAKAMSQTV